MQKSKKGLKLKIKKYLLLPPTIALLTRGDHFFTLSNLVFYGYILNTKLHI